MSTKPGYCDHWHHSTCGWSTGGGSAPSLHHQVPITKLQDWAIFPPTPADRSRVWGGARWQEDWTERECGLRTSTQYWNEAYGHVQHWFCHFHTVITGIIGFVIWVFAGFLTGVLWSIYDCIISLRSVVDCMMDWKQPWCIDWSCITLLLISRELEEVSLVPELCTQLYLLLAVQLSVNMHATFM